MSHLEKMNLKEIQQRVGEVLLRYGPATQRDEAKELHDLARQLLQAAELLEREAEVREPSDA